MYVQVGGFHFMSVPQAEQMPCTAAKRKAPLPPPPTPTHTTTTHTHTPVHVETSPPPCPSPLTHTGALPQQAWPPG
jgi:hypothetical protein